MSFTNLPPRRAVLRHGRSSRASLSQDQQEFEETRSDGMVLTDNVARRHFSPSGFSSRPSHPNAESPSSSHYRASEQASHRMDGPSGRTREYESGDTDPHGSFSPTSTSFLASKVDHDLDTVDICEHDGLWPPPSPTEERVGIFTSLMEKDNDWDDAATDENGRSDGESLYANDFEGGGRRRLRRNMSDMDSVVGVSRSEARGSSRSLQEDGSAGDENMTAGIRRRQRPGMERGDSWAGDLYEQILDPDDPLVTGERKESLQRPWDLERGMARRPSYKERRKVARQVKIEYNVTSIVNRQRFLMTLAKALMSFGAPSHRIESQLLSAARILEIKAEFVHVPGLIMCAFTSDTLDADPSQASQSTETHFIKCGGRIALGRLHEVHQLYRAVVHDDMSAKEAEAILLKLLEAPPIYNPYLRCFLAFTISALICPLAFGGSFIDMWIAGLGSLFVSAMNIGVVSRGNQLYTNVFEVVMTILTSFFARGLNSINQQMFCYNAISSASIVSILPGFLILSGSLELASKNIMCGSVKMVYALIYTLFLGFGLQIGSDLFFLVDHRFRDSLDALAGRVASSISVHGAFAPINATLDAVPSFLHSGYPIQGTFTLYGIKTYEKQHIINGCYRLSDAKWWQVPFPWWTQFIIVPIFSFCSSLANLQPWATIDMIVMVTISCVSYAINQAAHHFILGRSDVVSSIGAFAVGILGNIYSRKFGGTAFTVMVTGVLFLVPSGLSEKGGITAQGNGIDIGGAMISVTIGITVGLFFSQALVYTFGSRKSAAIFSF